MRYYYVFYNPKVAHYFYFETSQKDLLGKLNPEGFMFIASFLLKRDADRFIELLEKR